MLLCAPLRHLMLAAVRQGNSGFSHLVEDDYEWITSKLCQVAAETAAGRVVSVLEGGYGFNGTARSVGAHLEVLLAGG